MKTITRLECVLLIAALPASVKAGQEPGETQQEQQWAGAVTSVNTQNQALTARHWQFTRTFNLGQKCAVSTVDNKQASLAELRPGEKVRIHYQNVEGVRVADRIAEQALRYDGTVRSINQKTGTLTMEEAPLYQPFRAPEQFHLAGDCRVVLWNGHDGTVAEVQPGDRISVIYELPGGSHVAYRIRERTTTFNGVADAIDASTRTVKAKGGSSEKQFALGDHCQVILSGQRTGHIKDLIPGQEYRFTYEEVNGINVLDRIASAPRERTGETASLK